MKTRTLFAISGSVTLVLALTACAGVSGTGAIGSPPAAVTVTATATSTAKVTVTATKQATVAVPRPVTRTRTATRTETETQTRAPSTTQVKTTTAPPPTRSRASQTIADQTGMSDAQIRSETASAVDVVETYWTDLFSTWVDDAGKPVAWWRPTLFNGDGFYDSAAGQMAYCDADGNNAVNAFFCGNVSTGTGYMAWDMQLFRENAYLGDAFFYMVVAHETAHAAQTRFEHDGEGPAVLAQVELQADCIGGATLAKAEQDGYLTVPDGALKEMTKVSLAIGDQQPGGTHGTSAERDTWFKRGYSSGDIEDCLGHL
jgi:predicted metalloprotease